MKNLTTLEILIKAKNLISKPENWCKGNFSIDESGNSIDYMNDRAAAYCAFTSINKIGHGSNCLPAKMCLFNIIYPYDEYHNYHSSIITAFNDHPNTTHDKIMLLFDISIEKEKKRLSHHP